MRQLLASLPMPPIYRDYTDLLLYASDIFLLATLSLWALGLLFQPRPLKLGPRFLSVPIISLTCVAAVSTISSVDPVISAYHVIRLVLLALFYAYTLNEITLNALIWPVVLQVLIQAIIGIAQVLQQHSLGLAAAQELALDPSWSGVSIVWADGIRSLRAYGLTDHPNILGGCLAFGLLLTGAWYAGSQTRWNEVLTAIFTIGMVGLLLTFSRSAWLALASGSGFCLVALWMTRQRQPLARWLHLGSAALVLLAPFLWHNLIYLGVRLDANDAFTQVALENRSLSERGNLVAATAQIWSEHPVLGIGAGALPQAEQIRYPDLNDFGADYQPAHLVVLDVAAEIGSVGAAVYLVVMIAPWLALWWNRKRLAWSPALIGISGMLLAVTIVGVFDYYTWLLAPGQLWQWLIWGVWGRLYTDAFTGERLAIGTQNV